MLDFFMSMMSRIRGRWGLGHNRHKLVLAWMGNRRDGKVAKFLYLGYDAVLGGPSSVETLDHDKHKRAWLRERVWYTPRCRALYSETRVSATPARRL